MKPTKGRIVLYTFPAHAELSYGGPNGQERTVPAVIVNVWSDTCVNLRVLQDGPAAPVSATSVQLKDENTPSDVECWEWPVRE